MTRVPNNSLDIETLQGLTGNPIIIAPKRVERYLPKELLHRVRFMGLVADQRVEIGDTTITAVTALHGGGRSHPLASASPALGYVVAGQGRGTLYYNGDTAYGPHFSRIGRDHQPQVAILPIGAYQPTFLLKHHHLTPEQAVQAAQDLGVVQMVPCHFGTFRLALEAVDPALPRFISAAKNAKLAWYLPPLEKKAHLLAKSQRVGSSTSGRQ